MSCRRSAAACAFAFAFLLQPPQLRPLRLHQLGELLRPNAQRVALGAHGAKLVEATLELGNARARAGLRLRGALRRLLRQPLLPQRLARLAVARRCGVAQLLELKPELARAPLALGGGGCGGDVGARVGLGLTLLRLLQRQLEPRRQLAPARRLGDDRLRASSLDGGAALVATAVSCARETR